jgi:hypothetical protein
MTRRRPIQRSIRRSEQGYYAVYDRMSGFVLQTGTCQAGRENEQVQNFEQYGVVYLDTPPPHPEKVHVNEGGKLVPKAGNDRVR